MKVLVCDNCGLEYSRPQWTREEGDICRKFGCFGTMRWFDDDKRPPVKKLMTRDELHELLDARFGGHGTMELEAALRDPSFHG